MDILKTYFDELMHAIQLSSWVIQEELSFRQIDDHSLYVKGELYLNGGFVLHVAEFVSFHDEQTTREKYRYHLQDAKQQKIARWDNAPHYSDIETFPNHRHNANDPSSCSGKS